MLALCASYQMGASNRFFHPACEEERAVYIAGMIKRGDIKNAKKLTRKHAIRHVSRFVEDFSTMVGFSCQRLFDMINEDMRKTFVEWAQMRDRMPDAEDVFRTHLNIRD